MIVRPNGRVAINSAPNPQGQAESYSQPSVPGNADAQAPPSSYPAAPGFLGDVPTNFSVPTSQDPYKVATTSFPVCNSLGDSPIVKIPGQSFRSKNPYDRSEGVNVAPLDPRDPNPTKTSYGGHS